MSPFNNLRDLADLNQAKQIGEITDDLQVIVFDPNSPSKSVSKENKRLRRTTLALLNQGKSINVMATLAETADGTSHVATIPIPAGAVLHGIRVIPEALWGAGTAVMKVGDTADDDGYFTGVNLKATDLLVGEILDTTSSTLWGGKEGAYLVAASGHRGPTTNNFGSYYKAGSNILVTVTVGTPAVTTGRTHVVVTYSLGLTVDPVVTA